MVCGELETEEDQKQHEDSLHEQLAVLNVPLEGAISDEPEPFYLWPEHLEAYALFAALRTQWRYGFNGPTGLDYAAVLAHMRAVRIPRRKFDELYAAVRIMEQGALEGFAKLRPRQDGG